jgi:SAM-dependent methyltransferase
VFLGEDQKRLLASRRVTTRSPSYGDSKHYDARYFAWQNKDAALKARLKVQKLAPYVGAGDTVLDFGAAGGGMLAGLPGAVKIGVEINDVAREAAKRDFGLDMRKTLADVPDGTADVVVSNHTLEHLSAPYDALCQLRPKLKPGGRLVLLLPIDDWRTRDSQNWHQDDINRHFYTWTPMNLGNLLDEAGYAPQELRIIHRTMIRFAPRLTWLPDPVFDKLSLLWSHLRHRQELLAVAVPKA